MKILFVYPYCDYKNDNPFVYTLVNGLKNNGCSVDCNIDSLWNNYEDYDIIHFQWPESIFNWKSITEGDVDKLNDILIKLKSNNSKIVYTRHNDIPHYTTNVWCIKLYELLENRSDAIIHLGKFSLNQIKNKSNDTVKHYIILHHTYDEIYKTDIDIDNARKELNIDNNKFVFLCFGAFRDDKERRMVINSFKELKYKNKLLLAPRFFKYKLDLKHPRSLIKGLFERIKFFPISRNMRLSSKFINNEMLPLYFISSNVIFLQRLNILNSGNIPLSFYFGKTVIGPNRGNVGELLSETDNLTFDPLDTKSIKKTMEESIVKVFSGQGNKNKEFACENLRTKKIVNQLKQIYLALLENDKK